MKATLAKALVLTLALALVLSGCNLIEVDAKMQADEDIAKIDKDFAPVVATYDGGEVTVSEVVGDFNNNYSQMAYMYSYFGIEMGHDQVHEIIEDALEQRVRQEIAAAHYDAGNSLSEDELNEVEETAKSSYDANLESAKESATGDTDEQKSENARVLLRANGMDYDSLHDSGLLSAKYDAMEQLLRDEVAELTDEELQEAYDAKVSEQQDSFTDGSSFENAMSSEDEIVCWRPDGYRTVKHILVKPSDETQTAYSDSVSALESAQSDLDDLRAELDEANAPEEEAEDEDAEAEDTEAEEKRTPEEIQADIDEAEAGLPDLEAAVDSAAQACLDEVKETTDAIYERLEAGDSFEDLIEEYGEDPGMQNEPTKTRGYCVSTESTSWETNFRDAAMALNQVGDYTQEPVVSGSGVHIIQYTGDIVGGEVSLDEVHDALYDETLETAKQTHADETIDGWVEEANPTYDTEAFESAVMGEEA